jgi:hypothetical protein
MNRVEEINKGLWYQQYQIFESVIQKKLSGSTLKAKILFIPNNC